VSALPRRLSGLSRNERMIAHTLHELIHEGRVQLLGPLPSFSEGWKSTVISRPEFYRGPSLPALPGENFPRRLRREKHAGILRLRMRIHKANAQASLRMTTPRCLDVAKSCSTVDLVPIPISLGHIVRYTEFKRT
jgi:hypothetical protein